MINEFKSYRNRELKYFIFSNLFVIILLTNDLKNILILEKIDVISIFRIIETTLIGSVLYLFTFVLDSLIPISFKSKFLLYIRLPKKSCFLSNDIYFFQMPGEYVFSKLKKETKDIRINRKRLIEKYEGIYNLLPKSSLERRSFENEQWYKRFKKHEKKERVIVAVQEYLLCRDMMASLCSFVIIYIMLCVLSITFISLKVCLYFIFVYLVVLICARNKAKRFVVNVIVEDLYDKEEK